MLSHLEDRIKEAMSVKFLTIKDFSDATSIPYPSMREYLAGKKKPGFDALASIVRATGVSADWLLVGSGSKYQQNSNATNIELLRIIIENVELLLSKMKKSLTPDKKAMVIAMLYQAFENKPEVDPITIRQMLEIAS